MPRAAVLGSPIGHSLSPVLHAAAYAALGLHDWRYAAHEVREDELAPFVAGLGEDWRGLSLTMPLKEVAFEVATEVSADARRTGAINTLVRDPASAAGWEGHNTDVTGLVRALTERLAGTPRSAAVLGGGATARSALVALDRLGVQASTVAVRTPAKAAGIGAQTGVGDRVRVVPLGAWTDAARAADVVVSTLPPAGGAAAAELLGGAAGTWQGAPVLLDVVYADWPTPLARAAARRGFPVVGGVEMLLHQAVEQVRLMTGRTPPVAAMREAVEARIG